MSDSGKRQSTEKLSVLPRRYDKHD